MNRTNLMKRAEKLNKKESSKNKSFEIEDLEEDVLILQKEKESLKAIIEAGFDELYNNVVAEREELKRTSGDLLEELKVMGNFEKKDRWKNLECGSLENERVLVEGLTTAIEESSKLRSEFLKLKQTQVIEKQLPHHSEDYYSNTTDEREIIMKELEQLRGEYDWLWIKYEESERDKRKSESKVDQQENRRNILMNTQGIATEEEYKELKCEHKLVKQQIDDLIARIRSMLNTLKMKQEIDKIKETNRITTLKGETGKSKNKKRNKKKTLIRTM
ncbi:hypothetical protein HHI36_002144 [Cryptolaemus montrouzieri]|uniref:Uncharacterized protein n=1 Tax=Cryptolaemus montrouzieri TaxID=559131 RepID=A0ABD2P9J9_9CUCU